MKLFRQEQGQASFEYVLLLGLVAVIAVIMLSTFALLGPVVIELLCPAVDTAPTPESCVGP